MFYRIFSFYMLSANKVIYNILLYIYTIYECNLQYFLYYICTLGQGPSIEPSTYILLVYKYVIVYKVNQ